MKNSEGIGNFSEALAALYATANGASWAEVPTAVQRYLGTHITCVLYVHHKNLALGAAATGLSSLAVRDYMADWAADDVIVANLLRAPPGRCIPIRELNGGCRLESIDVYQGFYRPYGMAQMSAWHFPMANGWFSVMSAQNSSPTDLSDKQRQRAERIIPHIQTALRLAERIRILEARARIAEHVLIHCRGAALICDPHGRVLDINSEVGGMLRRFQSLIRLRFDCLEATDPKANERLKRLLSSPEHSAAYRAPTLCLWEDGGREALDCTVLRFDPSASDDLGKSLRIVLLRRSGERGRTEIAPHHLQHRFALTHAEAVVLAQLMSGAEMPTIAETCHYTSETVRTYIKLLRNKLGCHSQAQLVSKAWREITLLGPPSR